MHALYFKITMTPMKPAARTEKKNEPVFLFKLQSLKYKIHTLPFTG